MAGTRLWQVALLWLMGFPLCAQQVFAWKYSQRGEAIVLSDSIIWVSSYHPNGQNLDARVVDSARVILISDLWHRGKLDIYLVDFLRGELRMLTATEVDERLPWMDQRYPYFLAVRKGSGRAYLWYYPKSGTSMGNVLYEEAEGSIANYVPIGGSELFIVRRTSSEPFGTLGMPATSLILYNTDEKKKRRILRGISPSIAWRDSALYFIHHKTDEIVLLKSYRIGENHPRVVTSLPRGCAHIAVLDSSAFVVADTAQLFVVRREAEALAWETVPGPRFSEMGWKRLLYIDAKYGWLILTVEKAP